MRFREKLFVLFVAVILSGLGFYLISSPFADLHTLAKEADSKTVESHLARYDGDASRIRTIVDSPLQITSLKFCSSYLRFLCAPGANK